MKIKFDEPSHLYWLNDVPVPSVTQVLDPLVDFSKVDPDLLERKRQIGTAMHRAIEFGDDLDVSSLDASIMDYYRAWLKFVADTNILVTHSELRVASSIYMYAGTLDILGVLGKRDALIDIKTTATIYPTNALQTAAYERAARETLGIKRAPQRFTLQLKNNGDYRLVPHNGASDLGVFLSQLNVYNWRKLNG